MAKESSGRDSSVSGQSASVRGSSTLRNASSATSSTAASRSRARPDSLPSALTTEINKDLAQRGRGAGEILVFCFDDLNGVNFNRIVER